MYSFNSEEIRQLKKRGMSESEIQRQISVLSDGAPFADITAPAAPENGIVILNPEDKIRYYDAYKNAKYDGRLSKFVPASGAATRMFKDLINAYNGEMNPQAESTLKSIRSYPFYKDLENLFLYQNMDIDAMIENSEWKKIIGYLLYEDGLNYADKPKALIKFCQYERYSRTALEEQVYETISLVLDKMNEIRIHFTISEKYIPQAKELVGEINETLHGVVADLTFSVQKPSTDTIAVDALNIPVKDSSGNLVFRPGGHGALIENLNDYKADIVFIKNIDNVVNSEYRTVSDEYCRYLCGYAADLEDKIGTLLRNIENCSQNTIEEAIFIAKKHLFKDITNDLLYKDDEDKRHYLYNFFNRPIRVCGMIKNTGEPGGGPFFVKNDKGVSLQIVESSQINMNDPAKKAIFSSSTHFNPVLMACTLRNYRGEKFDLTRFVDKKACFVTNKSFNGKEIKALELPGLWNGAMSDWITVFVEVPLETFCPAKTVNDLLKPERYPKSFLAPEI
jgi:hypothetical protein